MRPRDRRWKAMASGRMNFSKNFSLSISMLLLFLLGNVWSACLDDLQPMPIPESLSSDISDAERAEIYSALANYCRLALQNNSNSLVRCRLYAHWGAALEKQLPLIRTDFATARRPIVEPYIAGFQVAEAGREGNPNEAPAPEFDQEVEKQLTQFRAFFKERIVCLYSVPPDGRDELRVLVTKTIADKALTQEIVEAAEARQLRAKDHTRSKSNRFDND